MAYPRTAIFMVFALIGPLVGGIVPLAITAYQMTQSPVPANLGAIAIIAGLAYLMGGVQAMLTGAAAASSYDEDSRTLDRGTTYFMAVACAIFAILPMAKGGIRELAIAIPLSLAVHLSATWACARICRVTIATGNPARQTADESR